MKLNRKLCFVFFSFLTVAISLNAENLLNENSSFEVGRWGYGVTPMVFTKNWSSYVMPKVTDETAAHGQYSLQLSNPSGMDALVVYLPPIKFSDRTKVTISFYAKSGKENVPINLVFGCAWHRSMTKNFYLTTEWKRYSFSGEVMKDWYKEAAMHRAAAERGAKGVFFLQILLASVGSGNVFNKVWLDGIQIEKGELTDYAPTKSLEVSVDMESYPEKQFLVYTEKEKDNAVLNVYSTHGSGEYEAEYVINDVLSGKQISKGNLKGKLSKTGHDILSVPLPKMSRGLYSFEATAKQNGKIAKAKRVYGVIKDLTERRKKGPIFFGGSCATMEPFRKWYMKPANMAYRISCSKRNPAAYFKLASQIGWQWFHFYRVIGPLVNAPEKDVREWGDSDAIIDMCLKNGLDPMSLLTSHGSMKRLPKWLQTDKKSLGGASSGKGDPLPDQAAYEIFCEDAARHFKDKIKWWESWNEPGVKMRSHEYLPLLKACWRGTKKGNPQSKLLGLTGTWDMAGDLYGWVKRCFKIGAADYMDAIAIHGYHVKDRLYGKVVKEMAKEITGRDFEVWDTESGAIGADPYGFGSSWANIRTFESQEDLGSWLAKMLSSELASGVSRHSWFNLDSHYDHMGKYALSLLAFDGSPHATLIAHNAIIDLLVDAKFERELNVEGDSVAYLFESPKGPLCVYWNPSMNTTCNLNLPAKNIQLLDLFGRTVPLNKNKQSITLPINKTVRYLKGKNISMEKFANALENMSLKGLMPLRFEEIRLSVKDGKPVIKGSIRNLSTKPQKAIIDIVEKPTNFDLKMEKNITVSPRASANFEWPVKKTQSAQGEEYQKTFKITVETLNETMLVELPARILYIPKIDKKNDFNANRLETAWNDLRFIPLCKWARMKTYWNKNGLYFLIQIDDNDIVNFRERKGVSPWNTDGVELFFDWDLTGDFQNKVYNEDDVQLILAVKGKKNTQDEIFKGPEFFAGNKNFPLSGIHMRSIKSEKGYTMEIGIDWGSLRALNVKPSNAGGFTMSLKDMDSAFTQKRKFIWAGKNDNYKNTGNFGLFILEDFNSESK